MELRKEHQIDISKFFAALQNLSVARTYIDLGNTLKRI